MNSSILLTTNPSSQNPRILFSPFISSTPIRLSTSRNFCYRRRYRISTIRSCAPAGLSASSSEQLSNPVKSDLFGGKRELTGIQSLVDSMSPPIRIASSTLIVAGAIAAGYGLGSRFSGSRNVALGGAVALGVAGAGAAYALNSCVPEVAAANLHNYVVDIDDPGALKKEDIESIANKLVSLYLSCFSIHVHRCGHLPFFFRFSCLCDYLNLFLMYSMIMVVQISVMIFIPCFFHE